MGFGNRTGRSRCGLHARGWGFTLIELLVVISIVSVLISLLLPALRSARDAAESAACLSNNRQIGFAAQSYQGDFKGFSVPTWKLHNQAIPSGTLNYQRRTDFSRGPDDLLNGVPPVYKGTSSSGWIWSAYLLGHLGSTQPLYCPSRQSVWVRQSVQSYYDADPTEGLGHIPLNGSYGINNYIYQGLSSGFWVRPEMMSYPARTSFIFDYTFYIGGVALNAASQYAVFPGLYSQPTTAVMHATLASSATYSNMARSPRHAGTSINALFHDGHASAKGVFDLHNPNLGGANGVTNAGITVEGDKFWGRNPSEPLARIRVQQN